MPTVKSANIIISQANFVEVLRGQEAFFTFNIYQDVLGKDIDINQLSDYTLQ